MTISCVKSLSNWYHFFVALPLISFFMVIYKVLIFLFPTVARPGNINNSTVLLVIELYNYAFSTTTTNKIWNFYKLWTRIMTNNKKAVRRCKNNKKQQQNKNKWCQNCWEERYVLTNDETIMCVRLAKTTDFKLKTLTIW